MSEVAIRVENLSKRYRIGLVEEKQDTLGGAIVDTVRRPLRNLSHLRRLARFNHSGREPEDVIWALRDVSFEVGTGEVVGIIGRNGAGKSTLLKILSRITEPTQGQAIVRGRVRSLLEVGTGFHAELTGRENIYLNGTLLGMRKKEIDRKFDEIVHFSGVEKFIDTPVKRYSTGMKVRLAFSVAAHLEPQVLLVDEVLAVGDAEFQKKCLGKMKSVTDEGRTVLFVSHNMPALQNLCPEAILLVDGQLKMRGKSSEVIDEYLQKNLEEREGEYVWRAEKGQDQYETIVPISLPI
jgi:lipopolysaccharide transport system ATP-binding protein